MTIQAIRFRTEGEHVVLQVQECTEGDRDSYFGNRATVSWRDAKVEDMLHVARFTFDPARYDKRLESMEQQIAAMHYREQA